MKTIAKAFVLLAEYLEDAQFADPDVAQGAEGVVGLCLIQASDEERQMLRLVAAEQAAELRLEDGREEVVKGLDFYKRFIERLGYLDDLR